MEDTKLCQDNLTILCLRHSCSEHRMRIMWERAKVDDYMCNKCRVQDPDNSMQELTRLKYPFYTSQQVRYDLLLIPSMGNFLDDYRSATGLHIGIASGQGTIIDFSHAGINSESQRDVRWQQCIRLNFMEKLFGSRYSKHLTTTNRDWDTSIEQLLQRDSTRWIVKAYHESNNNCFDFILKFIQVFISMNKNYEKSIPTEVLECFEDKIKFCHVFVIPETKAASRYICTYKRLLPCDSEWIDD